MHHNHHFHKLFDKDNLSFVIVQLVPEIIEQKLAEYIPYRFFVIGKEDNDLGQKLVLVIENDPYHLLPEVFDSLEKYEKPKETIFVQKFKETATGKVLRKETMIF